MPGTYILNRDTLEPISFLEDYQKITWKRSFYKEGNFSMDINFNQFSARDIQKGNLIGIAETPSKQIDHVFLIEQIELNQAGSVSEEILTATGRDVGGMLQERLIVPPDTFAYSEQTGPAESLMKFFVNVHLGPGADPNRQLPNLFIATDQGRQGLPGVDFEYKGRYQILSEGVEEISRFSELGWEIFFDIGTQTFQFDVIPGINRTIGSANPVVFDFEFESVLQQRLLQTDLGRKTFAYVGGDGELANRDVVETFLTMSEPSGFGRREAFVDAQDQDTINILSVKGDAFLRETDIDDAIEIDLNTFGPFAYRTNWDLGDVITIRNRKWNFQKDMRIVDVTLEITPDRPRPTVKISMDKPLPTFQGKLKQQFNRYEPARRV